MTTPLINYSLYAESDADEVSRLLGDVSAERNAPALAVGLTANEFEAFVRLYGPKAQAEGLTVVARSAATGGLVGALLAEDSGTEPPVGLERRTATPLLNGQMTEGFPQFSPDGRWFAYNASTSTTQQVFIESFPRGRGKWQVPSDQAQYPRWRADGRELYFLHPAVDQRSETSAFLRTGSDHWAAMAVDVRSAGAGLEFGPPRRLFEARRTCCNTATASSAHRCVADVGSVRGARCPRTARRRKSEPRASPTPHGPRPGSRARSTRRPPA